MSGIVSFWDTFVCALRSTYTRLEDLEVLKLDVSTCARERSLELGRNSVVQVE